jgi:uncharacterized membrane protein SpoIIM required for sporulation
MRETDFIEQNKEKWERYEHSLQQPDQDPELLTQLYVHTTDDLSISRTFYPNRSVRVYLNGLAQRTFLYIYRGRRGELIKFFTFWTDEMPRTVYASRHYLLTALAVFLLSMAIGVLSYRIDPYFAETILGESYVRMTEANIAGGDPMAVYKTMDQLEMSLHITLNNLLVAFLTFLAGAFACVGTLVFLIRNGVMLGVFQYFFIANGEYKEIETAAATGWAVSAVSWLLTAGGDGLERVFSTFLYMSSGNDLFRESLLTIWIHGALEISSIVIAGGAGLTMGAGLLFPGTLTRFQSFTRSARAGLKIMLGTVPLFIVAGFLEGYVTRQTDLPDGLRFVFILFCFIFIVWYYVVYPRTVANRSPQALNDDRLEVPSRVEPHSFRAIRTVGEQLSLTIGLMRYSIGRLLVGALLLSAAYCLLSFIFGGGADFRYQFTHYFVVGELSNFHELLSSFGRGRSLSFSVLVAAGFYGMFRLAFSAVFRRTDLVQPPFSVARELRLFGVCFLLALTVAFGGVTVALLTFLTLPFLLVLGINGYLEAAPGKVFRLVYTNLGFSYGLVFIITIVALPVAFLLDYSIGSYFFSFFDWIIYTDATNIDARNIVLQAFCYYFFLSLLFCSWVIALTLALGTLSEVESAGELKERIAHIGSKRRLRGMERE